jgi:hypothetical protein
MSALNALGELFATSPLLAKSGGIAVLLIGGPLAGGATYMGFYTYYRNTDKSNQFERETKVDCQPVTGSDTKVNELRRTKRESVPGDNRNNHRARVQRVQ